MAPHIVSWAGDERSISPVSSVATSIVSIESILSPPNVSDSEIPRAPQSLVKSMSFPGYPGNRAPRGVHLASDDPFIRHDKYFFKDGNITFLVDGTLYCVHRYFFSRDSVYFSARLVQLGIREHEALPIVISLGDIERKDFEAFLSIIYPDDFEEHGLSYEQWKSVLHLSTRWGFASLRKLALRSIEPPTPFDQLLLARAYNVDRWVLPALSALCERTVPLSLNEARQMSIEDVVLVTTVREDIRHHVLQVDSSEIEHCIEAAQAGMLAAVSAGNRTSPRDSTGDETFTGWSTERSPGSKAGAESEEDAKTAVEAPVDVRRANAKKQDPPADGGGSPVASPVAVRPANKPGRPSSAWGKILVVPSPTLTVPPHSPVVCGSSTDPLESHDPSAWRRLRVQTARRSSPGHIQVRTSLHDPSDASWS